eukprot:2953594-Ditylum_brightwellii.AAC.1
MAFILPSTMTMMCNCEILGLPGSFSSMTSIAVCHCCCVKPQRKGNAIIVASTKLILSDKIATRQ